MSMHSIVYQMQLHFTASTHPSYANDPQSIALQQAELQAKILSILSPSAKLTAESNKAVANDTAAASTKPTLPVLTPSNSASTAFKAPSGQSTAQTSDAIGMAISNIRSSGASAAKGSGTSYSGAAASYANSNSSYSGTSASYAGANYAGASNTSYSGVNQSYSAGSASYSGYPSTAASYLSQYRSPVPSSPQNRGAVARAHAPGASASRAARPTGSPAYPRYPATGQVAGRGGYRASYPGSYQARY